MANVVELVGGRESEILAALGIEPDASGAHIRCPYPDHEDVHPSYRWIAGEAKAVCTCRSKHGIIDVVMNAKGLDFASAARWIEGVLSGGKTGGFDRLRKAVERKPEKGAFSAPDKLLSPPSDRGASDLARAYLAARLGVAPSEVVMPTTKTAGWSRLPFYVKQGEDFRTLGEFPCAVFEVVKAKASPLAHRIFLNADGSGKLDIEADGKKVDPKRLSSTGGADASGYAALFGSAEAAHLIACEGIEEGAAVAFAFSSEVKAGAVAVAAAYSAASLGTVGAEQRERLEARAAQADSTARAKLLEAMIARRDAAAERARADSAERRADSLAAIAATRRADVTAKAAKAAASSALVDFSTLPEPVLQALVDADDFGSP